MAAAMLALLVVDTFATGYLLAQVRALRKVVTLTGEHCQSVGGLCMDLDERLKVLEG